MEYRFGEVLMWMSAFSIWSVLTSQPFRANIGQKVSNRRRSKFQDETQKLRKGLNRLWEIELVAHFWGENLQYLVHQMQISGVLNNYGGWLLYIDKLLTRPMPDFTCVSKPPKLHATGIKIEKATRQRGIKADNLQEVGWRGFGRLIIIIELTLPMKMKHLLAEGRPGPRYPLFSSSNS